MIFLTFMRLKLYNARRERVCVLSSPPSPVTFSELRFFLSPHSPHSPHTHKEEEKMKPQRIEREEGEPERTDRKIKKRGEWEREKKGA